MLCGLFGSLATILGKMALSSDNWILIDMWAICAQSLGLSPERCDMLVLLFRGITFFEMLFCNALMISYFLKSLEKESSLHVTVISTATNFLLSGLLGRLVLKEEVSNMWYLGASIISAGICCISYGRGENKRNVS